MESLDNATAREFLNRGVRAVGRGVGHVGAFVYAIPTGIYILGIVRPKTECDPDLRPTLCDEIMEMYRICKPLSPTYSKNTSLQNENPLNPAVQNSPQKNIIYFPKRPS